MSNDNIITNMNYDLHNTHQQGLRYFIQHDPHLLALSKLTYQHRPEWWRQLDLQEPGIYILTGGRQIGKSTSCKLLIEHCVEQQLFVPNNIFYLTCDEIFDAKQLSQTIRDFLQQIADAPFLLIIDEITFFKQWDRVIKALADEGWFTKGICLLTGSDTLILKEAAMSFPGRRGIADKTDYHLYPLTFHEYVKLVAEKPLVDLFNDYLQCGGYLRAINDFAEIGEIRPATFQTYAQWIRGDFIKQGKSEEYLLMVLHALFVTGVGQVSYSSLTQKVGMMSKETFIDYCRLLSRMDILMDLQAFDQNKEQGFPRKARKFHFTDPFIQNTIYRWLLQEGYSGLENTESVRVESCVASHCSRTARTYYFKSEGEVDVIWLKDNKVLALEVKWANQLRSNDLKTLKKFHHTKILTKTALQGNIEGIMVQSVHEFLAGLA